MRSATPILDLETQPPASQNAVSSKGLLKAVPAALGITALIPAGIILFFDVLKITIPDWLADGFMPVEHALDTVFQYGVFVALPLVLFAMFLVTVVHEAGHAAIAQFYKWPILEFRVLPFSLQKQSNGWRLRVSWRLSPGGLVVANPLTSAQFHSRIRIYALGGPMMNLIAAIFILVTPISTGSMLAALSVVFVTWSFIMSFVNLLPLHVRDLELDGYVALIVSRNPRRLSQRLAGLKMRAHLLRGKPLNEMNRRWVALAESGRVSLQNRMGGWLAYSYWLRQAQLDRAALMLERMLQKSDDFDEGFRALLFAECAQLGARRGQKLVAQTWRNRASEFFLPEWVRCRCNTFVAWVEGDFESAYREAVLTRDAILKLDENAQRDVCPSGARLLRHSKKLEIQTL
jgi:hypothetical protein